MAKHLLSNSYEEEGSETRVWAMDLVRKYSKREGPGESHQLPETPSTLPTDQIRAVR